MATKIEIKERPILFNGEMVQAILKGRKSQTRRVIKPQPIGEFSKPAYLHHCKEDMWEWRYVSKPQTCLGKRGGIKCPYGKVGDKLWVRETCRVCNKDMDKEQAVMVYYYSDRSYHSVGLTDTEWALWLKRKKPFAQTSGRFMYKSLARTWLEITGIRVERVQDIDELEALDEGFICEKIVSGKLNGVQGDYADGLARDGFANAWKTIYPG